MGLYQDVQVSYQSYTAVKTDQNPDSQITGFTLGENRFAQEVVYRTLNIQSPYVPTGKMHSCIQERKSLGPG